ncbi:ABC transporter ATP-binding protein [Alcaligenes aquatilis]|uniref:ABC transporter ATP-binding protein n=1 Tax=Alcaligenes aquatilis TaxID=323284 RepID=UPI000D52AD39|nr:ABC transporter ATP-binding protein [Alcaligenes aquatilis]AWG36622.1 ABC transporter ATP-binding protein [Alcaligenes aquatilis]
MSPTTSLSKNTSLHITNLQAWYGPSHILQGLDLCVQEGELLAILGRNGAGKTTTLKAIMGLVPKVQGSVVYGGQELLARPAHQRFRYGLGYVPEERRIVPGLTVLENLQLGLAAIPGQYKQAERIEEIAQTFPRLKERFKQTASTMSGGEQQMLAIARALMSNPKLILLDEPSEGIMPKLVDEMFTLFTELRQQGKTVVLVEQNVALALEIADRAVIIDNGAVVHRASAAELLADQEMQDRYCAV